MSHNTYLSTDGSDLGEISEDVQELMIKVNNLQSQNEFLSKQLREQEHTLKSKIDECQIANTALKRTNASLEELLASYKANSSNSNKSTGAAEEQMKKVNELESKLLVLEQSEQNLKRKNQSLNREILDLKLQLDKVALGGSKRKESTENKGGFDEDFYDLDNLDEEKKFLIKEVLKDYEDVKKENADLRENALNTIAEKEMTNIELREQFEELKSKHSSEVHGYMQQIQELRNKCLNVIEKEDNQDDDRISLTSEEERELININSQLSEEVDKYKKELEEALNALSHEKEKCQIVVNKLELSNKELQQQVFKLTSEVNHYEFEKAQLEKVVNADSQSKNILVSELEHFQQNIRNLEEMKEKNEAKLKDHIKQLNEENHELDLSLNAVKEQKTSIEKELNELKISFNKKLKETSEKAKMEVIVKENEMLQVKDRIDMLTKERDEAKNDCELHQKNNEKLKNEFKRLREEITRNKEEHENMRKMYEDKWNTNERKHDVEKKLLNEQIAELKLKMVSEPEEQKKQSEGQGYGTNTLEDVLDDDDKPSEKQIVKNHELLGLKEENNMLITEINQLKDKLNTFNKISAELEPLKKENHKLKEDIKEMTEMYENQIKELQQKALLVNAELQSQRKKSTRKSGVLGKDQIQMLVDLENNTTRLTAENKFLTEKVDILTKEIAGLKDLNDNNVKFLKQELTLAEQTAVNAKVSLASLAYEKDCEIIKHKNAFKKLRAKVQAAMGTGKK